VPPLIPATSTDTSRIGDLRLQALTNYATFGDVALAKRCLYLFAATPLREDGLLSASCYEKPYVCSGGQSIVDFTQIYAAALLDYVKFSGDHATGHDLFQVALRQFEHSVSRCDKKTGLYVPVYHKVGGPSPVGGATWHFIDCTFHLARFETLTANSRFRARSTGQRYRQSLRHNFRSPKHA
jgi:alpha-L-rhamnosidase